MSHEQMFYDPPHASEQHAAPPQSDPPAEPDASAAQSDGPAVQSHGPMRSLDADAGPRRVPVDEQPSKFCTRCGKLKPISMFGNDSSSYDGLRFWCRQCSNQAARESTHRSRLRRSEQRIVSFAKKVIRDATRNAHFKPQKCSVVGCNEVGQRHHVNYNNPDEFCWLCRKHHGTLRAFLNAIKKVLGPDEFREFLDASGLSES